MATGSEAPYREMISIAKYDTVEQLVVTLCTSLMVLLLVFRLHTPQPRDIKGNTWL